MRFGRLVLELSPWVRQPDRNDDAVLPVALEIGRDLRVWNDFYLSVLLSLVKMGAVLVIVANIIRQQTLEMPFIHRNDLIQEIASTASDPTLRHPVLPRTSKGGPHGFHLQGSNGGRDFPPVLHIPIEDQKPGCRLKRNRLPQLLDNPSARGIPVTLKCRMRRRLWLMTKKQ
jgi:hypothetical protein